MIKNGIYWSKIVFCFMLFSCGTKDSSEKFHPENMSLQNQFLGEWTSKGEGTMYDSKLIINEDGTYDYYILDSFYRGFSHGNWNAKPTLIVLNSFEPDSCMYVIEFGQECVTVPDFEDDGEIALESTIEGCKPESDVQYFRFIKDSLLFKKDSLIHFPDKLEHCPYGQGIFKR